MAVRGRADEPRHHPPEAEGRGGVGSRLHPSAQTRRPVPLFRAAPAGVQAMIDSRELADPEFFSRLDNIELRARSVVEGFLHGLHRSPYIGFSVEFASHHEYVQGDDPRHINWKLYARQHRLYVKEFDGDTNLNLYVLLDVSGSMACASLGRSKLHYAATLAAALAHLAIRQHDAAGMTLFADSVLASLPPRATAHQQQEILGLVAGVAPRARP